LVLPSVLFFKNLANSEENPEERRGGSLTSGLFSFSSILQGDLEASISSFKNISPETLIKNIKRVGAIKHN